MLPLFLLALKNLIGPLPQLPGGGAVVLRVSGGQLLGQRGGQPRVRHSQHGAGAAAQLKAQILFAVREIQP